MGWSRSNEHLAGLHLGIGEHLRHVVDRRGRDAGRREDADDLRLHARPGPPLNDRGDLVAAVASGRRGGELGGAGQIGPGR